MVVISGAAVRRGLGFIQSRIQDLKMLETAKNAETLSQGTCTSFYTAQGIVHRVVNAASVLFGCRSVRTAVLLMLNSYGVMSNR